METGLLGIATCEFLLDREDESRFLEVNPRIQVEHPVLSWSPVSTSSSGNF